MYAIGYAWAVILLIGIPVLIVMIMAKLMSSIGRDLRGRRDPGVRKNHADHAPGVRYWDGASWVWTKNPGYDYWEHGIYTDDHGNPIRRDGTYPPKRGPHVP